MNNKRLFEFIDSLSFILFFIIVYKKIGSVGAGILGASMLLYYLIFILFIDGVGNTMARMVAVRVHRGFKENAKKIFGYVMLYNFFIGALFLVLFVSISTALSNALFKDDTTSAVICLTGLLFLIHGFSHNIKCYYIGCGGHIILTVADIIRAVLLPVGAVFALDIFSDYGTKVAALKNNDIWVGVYGAMGALLLICAVMLLRLLILLVCIRSLIKQDNYSFNEVRTKDGFKTFMRSFLPEYVKYIRSNLFPILVLFVSMMIFLRVNFQLGAEPAELYSKLGFILGPGMAITLFAIRVYSGYIQMIYSKLRSSHKKEDKKGLVSRYNSYAKNSLIIAFPAFVAVTVFSKQMCLNVFGCQNEEIFTLALVAGFVFLFAAIDGFFTAGLKALGYDMINLLGFALGFVAALIYILVAGKTGVKPMAYVISLLIFYVLGMLFHGFYALSYIGVKTYDVGAKAVKILIASASMFIVELILVKLISMNAVVIIISALLGFIIYLTVFVAIRGLNQKELGNLQGTFIYFPFRFLAGLFHVR